MAPGNKDDFPISGKEMMYIAIICGVSFVAFICLISLLIVACCFCRRLVLFMMLFLYAKKIKNDASAYNRLTNNVIFYFPCSSTKTAGGKNTHPVDKQLQEVPTQQNPPRRRVRKITEHVVVADTNQRTPRGAVNGNAVETSSLEPTAVPVLHAAVYPYQLAQHGENEVELHYEVVGTSSNAATKCDAPPVAPSNGRRLAESSYAARSSGVPEDA